MSLFQLLTISSSHHPLLHLLIFLTISLSNYFTFTPFHHHILLTILPSLLQLLTISPLTTLPFHDSHYPIPFTISTSHYFTLSPSHHFTCSLFSLSHPSYYLSLSLFCPLTFATVHHLIHSLIISTSFLFTLKLKLHSILFTSSPFHCPTYLTIVASHLKYGCCSLWTFCLLFKTYLFLQGMNFDTQMLVSIHRITCW